jgi:hypothetical protein
MLIVNNTVTTKERIFKNSKKKKIEEGWMCGPGMPA